MGPEGDFADFTYHDSNGKLTELLTTLGFIRDTENWSQRPPIYHLEVKSTSEPCNEPFFMSNNQMEKVPPPEVPGEWRKFCKDANAYQARRYTLPWGESSIPTDVYVILRVYNLEKETAPGFTAYVDPWAMYMNQELSVMARENFMVTPIA